MVLSPPARLLIALLTALAMFLGGYSMGRSHEREKQEVARLSLAQEANARYRAEVARGNAMAARLEGAKTKTRTVTKTLTREVVNYVTPLAVRHCAIPLGFVRLHDAAAANHLPAASRLDADAPGGVDLVAVAETVAENYGTCHEWREQLDALIDWHRSASLTAAPFSEPFSERSRTVLTAETAPYPHRACPPDSRNCVADPAP